MCGRVEEKARHLMQEIFRSFPMSQAWNLLDTSQALLFTPKKKPHNSVHIIGAKGFRGLSEESLSYSTCCLLLFHAWTHILKVGLGMVSGKLLLPVSLTEAHLSLGRKKREKKKTSKRTEMSFADIVIPCCPVNKHLCHHGSICYGPKYAVQRYLRKWAGI